MDKKNYIVFDNGEIGCIESICHCEKCIERGMAEIYISTLDGEYRDSLKANDKKFQNLLYFGQSLVDAVDVLIKFKSKEKEVKYLQSLVDFYGTELVRDKK